MQRTFGTKYQAATSRVQNSRLVDSATSRVPAVAARTRQIGPAAKAHAYPGADSAVVFWTWFFPGVFGVHHALLHRWWMAAIRLVVTLLAWFAAYNVIAITAGQAAQRLPPFLANWAASSVSDVPPWQTRPGSTWQVS